MKRKLTGALGLKELIKLHQNPNHDPKAPLCADCGAKMLWVRPPYASSSRYVCPKCTL